MSASEPPRDQPPSTAMAAQQAALRRVAVLVATGAAPADVFEAIAGEVAELLHPRLVQIFRWERDGTVTVSGTWGDGPNPFPAGSNWAWDDPSLVAHMEHLRTGQPGRIEDVEGDVAGDPVDAGVAVGVGSAAGAPVVVEGEAWGHVGVAMPKGVPLPDRIEERLAEFTELIAIAISNAEARVELARLAGEQAALRRVATLVAEEAPAPELFAKVAEELAGVLGRQIDISIVRFEPDETATVVAAWGTGPAGGLTVGTRMPSDAIAGRTQGHGIGSAVGCPIAVHGRPWGALVVARQRDEPLPAETERRASQFAELVATALANAEARAELQRLADEQAALRRVATLVAEAAAPTEVFDAVVAEVARIFGAAQVGMTRAEGPHEATIVAHCGQRPGVIEVGMRRPLVGDSVTARVLRTGRPARMEIPEEGDGQIEGVARRTGAWITLGAPIVVESEVWGVITAAWESRESPPVGTEDRLTQFAKLLDAAIANADSRDELTASRARVLAAGDEARRRVVRDLHDGAQQRLVHTIITLGLARQALGEDGEQADALLAEALDHARRGNEELRELAHGILPSVLTRGGLAAGIESLVARLDLSIHTEVSATRLPPEIESSAYFIVAEALTNVVKHSQATKAAVTAMVSDGTLTVEVSDDGVGGADREGHGLLGIADRAAALDGRVRIASPAGHGTVLSVALPLPA